MIRFPQGSFFRRILGCDMLTFADGTQQTTAGASGALGLYSIVPVDTGSIWIDGKPIFRLVVTGAGANNATTLAAAALAAVIETIVSATWSALDSGGVTFRVNRGTIQNGFDINNASGNITVFHDAINLTGDTVIVVLEYTKVTI